MPNEFQENLKSHIYRMFGESTTLTSALFNLRQSVGKEDDYKHWVERVESLLTNLTNNLKELENCKL